MNASTRKPDLVEQTAGSLRAAEVAAGADSDKAFIGDHERTLTPAAVEALLTGEPDKDDLGAAKGFFVFLFAGAVVWILAGFWIWHLLRR
jgi:hypothetical protein